MAKLILTVGLPKSGKTTYAASLAHPMLSLNAIGNGNGDVASVQAIRTAAALLFASGHQAVVIDAENTTRHRRYQWQCDGWLCEWHRLMTPTEICVLRAEMGGRDDLVPLIRGMARAFSPFVPDEGLCIDIHDCYELSELPPARARNYYVQSATAGSF